MNPILTEALALHERDYWVLGVNGKVTTRKDWPNERVERAELEATFTERPDLNIGIVLGPCGLLDLEYDNGADGEREVAELFKGCTIPRTPTFSSPRGRHRLFRCPAEITKTFKHGSLEIRVGNHYTVIPPSAGRKWPSKPSLHDVEPAELPPEVIKRLLAKPATQSQVPATGEKIVEGRRNDTLFAMACKLRDAGLAVESIEAAVLGENAKKCEPPLGESEVQSIVASAMKAPQSREKPTIAEQLLAIVENTCEVWHTPDDTPFVTIQVDGHAEHWGVRSGTFRRYLAHEFRKKTGGVVGSATMADVLAAVEGEATFDGPEHDVFLRVAEAEGRYYLDLANDSWSAVEIGPDGWSIVQTPPVRFRRVGCMEPLPEPVAGGSLDELRPFLNVDDNGFDLIKGWLVAAMRPCGPYPILKTAGEQGAAKTTCSETLRKLFDPNETETRAAPRCNRDLAIAACNSHLAAFDNLSYLSPEIADGLCRLATGGGFATRMLYTDAEEVTFFYQRPIIISGIDDISTRPDLVDRCFVVELLKIDAYRSLEELKASLSEALPRILGALLDAVSLGLRNLAAVRARTDVTWPRMADAAQWIVACEPALNLSTDFLTLYAENRKNAQRVVLDSTPLVPAIRALLARKSTFTGTATQLLNALSVGQDTNTKGWPKTPRTLSGLLTRLSPVLPIDGMEIRQGREGNDKTWTLALSNPTAAVQGGSEPLSGLAAHLNKKKRGAK